MADNLDLVKELMTAFAEADISKMKIEMNDLKLELEKNPEEVQTVVKEEKVTPVTKNQPAVQKELKGEPIRSPLVGTYYASPSPDAKPFVQEGDHVTKGQTLCIIEAMKVMNEIKAPKDGVIAEICVQTNDLVEYNQLLMTIEDNHV